MFYLVSRKEKLHRHSRHQVAKRALPFAHHDSLAALMTSAYMAAGDENVCTIGLPADFAFPDIYFLLFGLLLPAEQMPLVCLLLIPHSYHKIFNLTMIEKVQLAT